MATTNGYKLLLTYDVDADDMPAYYQFVLGAYIPGLQSLGWELKDAWHTAYGDWPNRLLEFITDDGESARKLLTDDGWATLNEQLMTHVTGFSYKLIPFREGFQY